ncbi:MAG: hypothetical protein KAW45_05770 [Thermoplasmatales archaeon]|nr:hypothetical protein [Thermoplasmatales archaeon]
MKKTVLTVLMASLIIVTSFSVCFTADAVSLKKENISIDNQDISDDYISEVELKSSCQLNLSNFRLLFSLTGLGLGLGWLLLFMKSRSSFIGISIMSMFTARWQKYGHENGYLPTNDMKPFTAEAMFMFILLEFSILTAASCLLGHRSGVMLALAFHLWLETGYWMGFM